MSGYWQKGEMQTLATAAGIPLNNLSDILHRRRGVSWSRALLLEQLTLDIFGHDYRVDCRDWAGNRTSRHPAFFGPPRA